LTLEAHDGYWGGRPYVDRVEIQTRRLQREQALDFELGKADVVELPLAEVRRAQQRHGRGVTSAPGGGLGWVFDNGKPEAARLRGALTAAVDRAAIQNVLLQKQGEISGALLPQWLSGYAFLFTGERNVGRARELAAGPQPLSFSYDRQLPLL